MNCINCNYDKIDKLNDYFSARLVIIALHLNVLVRASELLYQLLQMRQVMQEYFELSFKGPIIISANIDAFHIHFHVFRNNIRNPTYNTYIVNTTHA